MNDRSEMEAARLAGLQKRHEQRLENATYTAAEVKVLTDAALRLGRAEAAEEIAVAIEALDAGRSMAAYMWSAQTARDIGKGDPNG